MVTIQGNEGLTATVLTIIVTIVNYRVYTFILNSNIPGDKLTKSFVRQYSPLMEYGGWGLRLGLFGNGKAFNVSGDKGLQLEFTDNKKLLIGTNRPEELTETLIKIGQLKQ
ncbi:MAG: hypothetical protein IPO23_07190 [Flavobacterium sp.]|nr:hypothetical protein [Flavobacterium sp.]